MSDIPQASRPIMPKDYGVPETLEGALDWAFADNLLRSARVYWLSTLHPAGRPHTMPNWMAWLDNTLIFGTDPTTRKARNLALNPHVTVSVQGAEKPDGLCEAVIIEGVVQVTRDADLLKRADDQYEEKYGMREGRSEGYLVIPHKVFAMAEFPATPTRWIFRRESP
jgi:general stress protein 26